MRYEDGECGDFGYWIEDTVTGEKIENEKVVALLNNLYDENRELRHELEIYTAPNCKKCMNYCTDKADDYCLCDERENTYFAFPYRWDYKAGAEKCKYYYR